MTIIDIINKKRLNKTLTYEEINYVVNGYLTDKIADYQMSSLLMGIVINGMDEDETYYLTKAMLESGDVIDLSLIDGIKIDKHSTGGVGDNVTLILTPLLASMGLKVPKMSGRGLGHTGGTIDKLESIPGFRVELEPEEFVNQVNNIGACIISQTGNLVPADKKIYALRDVTGTVSSIPLIAASIMSKKIASGADNIIIDVKVGKGSLLNNLDEAKQLARLMVKVGKDFNKKVVCILTNMDEPLGYAIGNALEVQESIDVLKGFGPTDLRDLIIELGVIAITMERELSELDARGMVTRYLDDGLAYRKFKTLVECQGGNLDQLKISNRIFSVQSNKSGYIENIDALKIGELARLIGAGRLDKSNTIDHDVGLVLKVKVGNYVKEGEELVRIYLNNKDLKISDVLDCFTITDKKPNLKPLIYEIIS